MSFSNIFDIYKIRIASVAEPYKEPLSLRSVNF